MIISAICSAKLPSCMKHLAAFLVGRALMGCPQYFGIWFALYRQHTDSKSSLGFFGPPFEDPMWKSHKGTPPLPVAEAQFARGNLTKRWMHECSCNWNHIRASPEFDSEKDRCCTFLLSICRFIKFVERVGDHCQNLYDCMRLVFTWG